MQTCFTIGMLFVLATCAHGQSIPEGYTIPETTLSPDHRYGVTVPIAKQLLNSDDWSNIRNRLVEMEGGRVVATIQGEAGWDRSLNYLKLTPPRWSEDGSLLLWTVQDKWCPAALALMKLSHGKLVWQADILHLAQQAILARTKVAAPRKYAAAKKANKGNGSAYPQGFTINVKTVGAIELPLDVAAVLTSNTQEIKPFPDLNSHLEGLIDAQGKLRVTDFHLGTKSEFDNF